MPASVVLKQKLEKVLRSHFPNDTVDVSDGYHDNVHVVVVSREFDGLKEKEKQDRLWQIIDDGSLTDEERSKISMILPWSPRELK